MDLSELKTRYQKAGIRFECSVAGMPCIQIETPCVAGEVYLQGAHITQFRPANQQPVLWMSQSSYFELGKPIRGGVPICFPWFGPHATDTSLPGHGWARLANWQLIRCDLTHTHGVEMEFATQLEDWQLTYQVQMEAQLRLRLTTRLQEHVTSAQRFEDALHTYFSIGDIRRITVHGLETAKYTDKVGTVTERNATDKPIFFEGETDRVYHNTHHDCRLIDEAMERTIHISKSGSSSTVVWNPWIEKSRRMPDFGDDEWERMVCIETANIGVNAITLEPGGTHVTEAVISV